MSDEIVPEIEVSLGALHVRVRGEDLEETEEVFERVWEERMVEAEDIQQALRDGAWGHQ